MSVQGSPMPNEIRNMLDVIMKEMFRRADLVDLYSLADPERCSNYLVVAASAIKDIFTRVHLEPRLGEKGDIFFQRITDLKRKNPMGEAETTKACKQLSFFFIRIFHIYAACTLSIIDSDLPTSDEDKVDGERKVSYRPSGKYLSGFEPPKSSWFGAGGALVNTALPVGSGSFYLGDNAGLYKILNRFLIVPSAATEASTEPMRFDKYSLFISQDQLYTGIPAGPRVVKDLSTQPPIVQYSFRKSDSSGYRIMSATLNLATTDANRYLDVTLENISMTERRGGAAAPPSVHMKLHVQPGDDNPKSDKNEELPAAIIKLFNQAKDAMEPPKLSSVDFLKNFNIIRTLDGNSVKMEGSSKVYVQTPRSYVGRSTFVVEYTDRLKVRDRTKDIELQAEVRIEKGDRSSQYRVIIDLEGMETEPRELKEKLDKRTRSYETFTADESNPGAQPMSLDRGAVSIPAFIEATFAKILKTYSAEGRDLDETGRPKPYNSAKLPEEFKVKRIWKALAQRPPIKGHCVARALQLLNASAIRDPTTNEKYSSVCRVRFPYIKDGTLPVPGESISSSEGIYAMAMLYVDKLDGPDFTPKVTQTPAFDEFKRRLKSSFERIQAIDTPGSIADIREKQIAECQDHKEDLIYLDRGLTSSLRAKANELMRQQMTHVANVMRILFKLFDERSLRAGAMKINGNILAGGMPSLNALAEEARNVLIAYYSNCEKTYTEGLLQIEEANAASKDYRPARR